MTGTLSTEREFTAPVDNGNEVLDSVPTGMVTLRLDIRGKAEDVFMAKDALQELLARFADAP